MDTDKVVRAMARWWQTVSQEDNDPNAKNPMLYDPLQDGTVRTSKTMQYVAAIVVSLGAVSAGTALAWTSPVLSQLIENGTTVEITSNAPSADQIIEMATTELSDVTMEVASNVTDATLQTISDIQSSIESTELYLTLNQRTWVGSLLGIGAFFGAIPSGFIADAIGRKYAAMVMDIPFILAWLSIWFANSAGWLYLGRFLVGVSTGSFCVIIPMYISEIAETSIRGSLGTFFQLFLTIGIFLVYLIGSFVHWKTLSALCLLVPVVLLVAMFFLPETPTYLLKKGRRGDAALSLKWLWGRYCDSRSAIQMIQADLDSSGGGGGGSSIVDLFTNRGSLKGLFLAISLMFFQQFSGINAVIFYTQSIFESAGSTLKPSVCSIIVGIVQVLMTFASTLLIERAGRKILLLISSIVMGVCLAILGLYFSMKDRGSDVSGIGWLPLACVVLFIISFSIGFGPIPWLMMGELFSPDIKGIAVSLSVMANWTMVFIITKSFDIMIATLGSTLTFWFFGSMMGLGTLFVCLCIFETKGKSPAQIQMLLSGTKIGNIMQENNDA